MASTVSGPVSDKILKPETITSVFGFFRFSGIGQKKKKSFPTVAAVQQKLFRISDFLGPDELGRVSHEHHQRAGRCQFFHLTIARSGFPSIPSGTKYSEDPIAKHFRYRDGLNPSNLGLVGIWDFISSLHWIIVKLMYSP